MTQAEKDAALEVIRQDREENPDAYAIDDKKFTWEDIAAGGYSAANSALFGIPDVLVKAASSDVYGELKALRARNKTANTVGDIAGAFAPTGGLLAKGVGTGLKLGAKGLQAAKLAKAGAMVGKIGKGADTVSDIIKTGKGVSGLKGGIVRGALGATEQVVPRLIGGETDLGEAGLAVGLGAGIGAAGYGLGKAAKRVPEMIEDAKKWADKTILKRANITDKVMRAQKAFMGDDISKYYAELADLAEARELHRGPELDKLVDDVKATWRKMGKEFDASDFKLDPKKVVDADDVAQALKRDTVGTMGKVDDIVTKVEKTDGFVNKRKFLNEILYDQGGDVDKKKIARAVLNQIEDQAEHLTGLDIGKAKADWRMMKPFEAADILDDMRVAKGGLAGGSDTVFKLGLAGLAGGSGVSGLKDVQEEPTNPMAWAKLIGAGVLGGSMSGMAREKIGIALAKAIRAMPTEQIAEIAQKIAEGKLPQVLSKLKIESPTMAATKFISGKLTEEETGEPLTLDQAVKQVNPEATADPEVEEAQEEKAFKFGDEYVTKLNEKMLEYWAENFADTMDFNEYVQQVAVKTNNFDPKKTASFLYRDKEERSKFLRDLDISQKLAGTDIEETFSAPKFGQGIFDAEGKAQKVKARQDMVDTIAKLVTDEGNLPTKATLTAIEADVAAIMALPASKDEKKELLFDKLSEKYGLGIQSIRELGLV